ncbi:hypothetical protein LCGC14_2270880 [marine sediment metagenome]|uniref:phosphoglycerate mutase (2,3-diphosphoglycerate-independent) n=1 Tax=marine sediment metagenome TaxID=412755 RepID=A0A0F9FS50_9ZZZZ
MNFRPDRARQLTRAFVDNDFSGFDRTVQPSLADFVMTTEYAADIHTSCAFPPENLSNSFGEYLSNLGKTQLRIAETEKYAHVTFFFSGGREEEYQGETRILVPSPDVATYDLQPEMSAPEVTDKLVEAFATVCRLLLENVGRLVEHSTVAILIKEGVFAFSKSHHSTSRIAY